GNFIGTSSDGLADLGNAEEGVLISNSPNNTVGGTTAAARNLISSNHWGVVITGPASAANVVQGNFIGTDVSGTKPLGNELDGVLIQLTASNTTVGGTSTSSANSIAFNERDGVRIADNSRNNAILTNSIFSNALQGIDLVDPASNHQQPAPILTGISS